MDVLDQLDMSTRIAAVLRAAVPDIMAAYIYGSMARGDNRGDSDVDIAVLLPPRRTLNAKLALVARLAETVGRSVDVVDMRRAGNFLRMEVFRNGRQILNTAPEQVLAWEARAMSEYAQHNAAIHEIMQDFRRTGIGYHR